MLIKIAWRGWLLFSNQVLDHLLNIYITLWFWFSHHVWLRLLLLLGVMKIRMSTKLPNSMLMGNAPLRHSRLPKHHVIGDSALLLLIVRQLLLRRCKIHLLVLIVALLLLLLLLSGESGHQWQNLLIVTVVLGLPFLLANSGWLGHALLFTRDSRIPPVVLIFDVAAALLKLNRCSRRCCARGCRLARPCYGEWTSGPGGFMKQNALTLE